MEGAVCLRPTDGENPEGACATCLVNLRIISPFALGIRARHGYSSVKTKMMLDRYGEA
jgi:hypothetical protein